MSGVWTGLSLYSVVVDVSEVTSETTIHCLALDTGVGGGFGGVARAAGTASFSLQPMDDLAPLRTLATGTFLFP